MHAHSNNAYNERISITPSTEQKVRRQERSLLFRLFHNQWIRRGATVMAVALAIAALAAAFGAFQ